MHWEGGSTLHTYRCAECTLRCWPLLVKWGSVAYSAWWKHALSSSPFHLYCMCTTVHWPTVRMACIPPPYTIYALYYPVITAIHQLCSMAGISRAVTMTAVYLMAVSSLKHREALQVVKHCRPIAAPNSGFTSQLADFEVQKLSEVCTTRVWSGEDCTSQCLHVLHSISVCQAWMTHAGPNGTV